MIPEYRIKFSEDRWVVNVYEYGRFKDLVYFDTVEELCRYLDRQTS